MSIDPLTFIEPHSSYSVAIELLTDFCNLNCIYCGRHTDNVVKRKLSPLAISHIVRLMSEDRPKSVNIGGNGEITILENWMQTCEQFLTLGEVTTGTNLAKVLTDEEASILARFGHISTSIDTADANLLKEIRKPVQLRNIVFNIIKIKEAALSQGRNIPSMSICCVVSSKNYKELRQLIALASSMGVNKIHFIDLCEHEQSKTQRVFPISQLEKVAQSEFAKELDAAFDLAKKIGVKYGIDHRLLALKEKNDAVESGIISKKNQSETVLCLHPWNWFWLNSDEKLSICCKSVGKTDADVTSFGSIHEVMNNEHFMNVRKMLLSGNPPEKCRMCNLAKPSDISQLRQAVNNRKRNSWLMSNIVPYARHIPFARAIGRRLLGVS